MADRMNDLTGKEWLQNSFTIWRDIQKKWDVILIHLVNSAVEKE